MTERDWEAAAIRRLEGTIAGVVDQLRRLATRIQEEAAPNIESARIERADYSTYGRVAERVVHEVMWGMANLNLSNVMDAAADAAAAHTEKKQATPLPEATAKKVALLAVLSNLDGWIEGAQENHEALAHRGELRGAECWQEFAPDDIRRMVNDAAREIGVTEFPLPKKGKEDRK